MGASESRWDRFRFGLTFQKGIPLVETQPNMIQESSLTEWCQYCGFRSASRGKVDGCSLQNLWRAHRPRLRKTKLFSFRKAPEVGLFGLPDTAQTRRLVRQFSEGIEPCSWSSKAKRWFPTLPLGLQISCVLMRSIFFLCDRAFWPVKRVCSKSETYPKVWLCFGLPLEPTERGGN